MIRAALARAAALLALATAGVPGCSNLTESEGGIVGIEITVPSPPEVAVGGMIQLTAQALGRDGGPVAASISWATPDATLSVDQNGLVTGLAAGSGRVQAFSGAFASALITLTVVAPPGP